MVQDLDVNRITVCIEILQVYGDSTPLIRQRERLQNHDLIEKLGRIVRFQIHAKLRRRALRVLGLTVDHIDRSRRNDAQALAPVVGCKAVVENYVLRRPTLVFADIEAVMHIVTRLDSSPSITTFCAPTISTPYRTWSGA